MKKVLLGSGGFRTSVRMAFMIQAMKQHLGGDIRSMLFIPYALKDHDAYLKTMHTYGLDAGYELKSIHLEPDPVRAIQEAEAIFVGGGNTFRLLKQLQTLGLVELIRKRVLEEGTPYIGISAGSNVACPTIKTTNDMPIVECPSLDAMGLVDFQINAHYYQAHVYVKAPGDTFIEHLGETRNERLSQYLEECDIPVVGLPEGCVLKCNGDAVEMLAPEGEKMTVFRRNSSPFVIEGGEGVDLAAQLLRQPQQMRVKDDM